MSMKRLVVRLGGTDEAFVMLRVDVCEHSERGLPQARLTADTRCSFCGRGFKAGDHVIARLAIPPAEATWRHAECGEIQPHWQIRQGSWEIPSGEDIFSAQRALDEFNREQRDTLPDLR